MTQSSTYILVLLSFVYAAAVTQVLSTAGDIFIASKRVRLSWLNAGWMCASLLFTCYWWIVMWSLHTVTVWSVHAIAFDFALAAGVYLNARLVSPRIPEKGEIDLNAFHVEEGRKYLGVYAILSAVTIFLNAMWVGGSGGITQWSPQNTVMVPMGVATGLAAIYVRKPWVQAVAVGIQILGWFWYFAKLEQGLQG